MTFRVTIARGYVSRSIDVEANNEPHARQIAESLCGADETVQRVILSSRATIDPKPRMPADHARKVAESAYPRGN